MPMAIDTRSWTIEDLDRLPDDGNRYEVVRGALFVTPPPSTDHETIAARLSQLLTPYVAAHGLGYVYHPRSVIQRAGSQTEPDLTVRQPPSPGAKWERVPMPILVVEVLSRSTEQRDRKEKRSYYLEDAGIPEYWIVDGRERSVTIVRPGVADVIERDRFSWLPGGAGAALDVVLSDVFG
jgi:Uma2 family endonuclease